MAQSANQPVVKVAGIWEMGWNTPMAEFELWHFPLRDFRVDEFYMTPISGIDKEVTELKSLDEAIERNQDLTVVFVDEKGETPLAKFAHPQRALYVLGRTSVSPMQLIKKDADLSVRIETKPDQSNEGMLWAHQAISIVLYDRLRKNSK